MSQLTRYISDTTPYPNRFRFSVYPSAIFFNVTGDGSVYRVQFDTKRYDVGNAFNTVTHEYVTPATGVYLISWSIGSLNLGAGHTAGSVIFKTSGSIVSFFQETLNSASVRTDTNFYLASSSFQINLNAGETIHLEYTVSNSTKTVSVQGGSATTLSTLFSGFFLG